MEKTIYLVDAYAFLYRFYYVFMKRPMLNSKGFNTGPVLGFVRLINEIIEKDKPTHIAVAFDGNVRPFRFKLFDQYKNNREKTPEDIIYSVPLVMQILDAMHITHIQVNNSEYDDEENNYSFEADDIIGTMAKLGEKAGMKVFMVTPDKDYAQLVSENISIKRPEKGGGYSIYGIEEVKKEWNIETPEQMIDYLAIAGDSSDNYPGCKGIGPVGAADLIKQYGTVENIYENVDNISGKNHKALVEHHDEVLLCKTLARIRTDVPLDFDEDKFQVVEPDKLLLSQIYNEHELKSLLKTVGAEKSTAKKKTEKTDAVQLSLFDELPNNCSDEQKNQNLSDLSSVTHSYQLIENEKEIDDFLAKISAQNFFCFDTETTSINTFKADLVGISFSWTENEAFFVRMPQNREDAQKIVDKFKPLFKNPDVMKIGQNMKYDILVLANYGVEVCGKLFDTMIAHYLIQPELKHNMDFMAEVYLKYATIHYDEMMAGAASIWMVDKNKLKDYAAEDADVTLKLYNILKNELSKNGLDSLFADIEMPLMKVLAKMEMNGVRVDTNILNSISISMTKQLNEIEQSIFDMAGYNFNISSPRQVGELIYDKLQIADKPKLTKTGQYSTSESVLEELRGSHPVVDKILDYRGLKKLISTYLETLPKLVNPKTKNIHTSFNQTITSTGRLSSSDPNLQNIPVRDAIGRDIRTAFVAEEGCTFLSADYSQIELRLMAHFSQDKALVDAFNSGEDVHASTASKIFKVPISEVTSDMRRKAKTANFGIIYGISAFGLAQRLGISRTEAKQIIDDYFESFPGVKQYMDRCIEQARKDGYVETLLHRKRFLPDINSRNQNVRQFSERNAINAPLQGTAADIIKIAMVNIQKCIDENGLKTKMTMQVHDELNFSVPVDELEQMKQIVVNEMQNAMKLSVPLIVDCGVGENWLIAH